MATVLTVIILNSISLVPSKPNGNISFKIQIQITDVSFERAAIRECTFKMRIPNEINESKRRQSDRMCVK